VRTIHECMQAVLWNGTIGLTPMGHALPEGLTCVLLADMPPAGSWSLGTATTRTR
jgi:hypothetical protein